MLLIPPRRTRRGMTTINLPMLFTDRPVCLTSIVETPFCCDSDFQIPQSDFRAIPATCFVNDSSQVSLDHGFCRLDLCCDLRIRATLRNKRCDSPLSTCKIHGSRQQRHYCTSCKQQSCHLHDHFAMWQSSFPTHPFASLQAKTVITIAQRVRERHCPNAPPQARSDLADYADSVHPNEAHRADQQRVQAAIRPGRLPLVAPSLAG